MKRIITLLTFLVLGLTFTQCQGQRSQKLPFSVIDSGPIIISANSKIAYQEPSPAFLIITDTEKIKTSWLNTNLHTEVIEKLNKVNYQNAFAIIILRGRLGGTSSLYTIEPAHIIRENDTITLEVYFQDPPADTIAMMASSSPYKILQVRKKGTDWNKALHFVLEVNGQVAQEHTYFVP